MRRRAGSFSKGPLLRDRLGVGRTRVQDVELHLQLEELDAGVHDQGLHGSALLGSADGESLPETIVHEVQRDLRLTDGRAENGLRAEHLVAQHAESVRRHVQRGVDPGAPLVEARHPSILPCSPDQGWSTDMISSAAQVRGAGPTGTKGSCTSCGRHCGKDGGRTLAPITRGSEPGLRYHAKSLLRAHAT